MATNRSKPPKAPKRPNLTTGKVDSHRLDGLHIYRDATVNGKGGYTIIAFRPENLHKMCLPAGE